MPLKNPNPFHSRAAHLDAGVNPYVALLRDAAQTGSLPLAFGAQLETLPGRWREHVATAGGLTSTPARLVLEIGIHKGRTLVDMAADQAGAGFVGLDITYKRVVTTAQRLKAQGLKNAFCAMANAQQLDRLFAPAELDGVVIFFPDPWVKKARQAKHRLVDSAFVARLATVVRPGGYVWLKTDQKIYFDGAMEAFADAPFALARGDEPGLPALDYTSSFEQRFHAQNLPTYSGKWLRSATPRVHLA